MRIRAALLWAALLAAFSPVLVDTAGHLAENPWARYAAIFPLLFARLVWREPAPERARADGMLFIAVGLAIFLLAVFAGTVRFGRPGLALAAIGLCRRFALASPGSQVLLLFCVPIPDLLVARTSPELPAAVLASAAALLGVVGTSIETEVLRATAGAHTLLIDSADSGIALAPLLAGLAWYDSRMVEHPLWKATVRAGVAALLAIPLQVFALLAVLLLLSRGDSLLAGNLLANAPWIAVAALSLLATELRARRTALA